MSIPLKISPDEMRLVASDLSRLSSEADQIREMLNNRWRHLDAGWISYARMDVNQSFYAAMRELVFMSSILNQMSQVLQNTAQSIEAADVNAKVLFENSQSNNQTWEWLEQNVLQNSVIREFLLAKKAGLKLQFLLASRLFFGIGLNSASQVTFRDPFGKGLRALVKKLPGPLRKMVGTPQDIRQTLGFKKGFNTVVGLKSVTGLQGLSNVGVVNSQVVNPLAKGMMKNVAVASTVLEVVKTPFKWHDSYLEYGEQGTAHVVAAGTMDVVDGALQVAGTTLGTGVGAKVGGVAGAAIGQALIPIPGVGAVVGGVVGTYVGGFVGGTVGSWAAGMLSDSIREPGIEFIAGGLNQIAANETVQAVTSTAGATISEAASAVGEGIGKTAANVSDTAKSLGKSIGKLIPSW